MAFFDNLSEVLSSKGKEAADAAKKVAEIANLKTQIASLDGEIKKNYRLIGEAYFEAHKDDEVICEFEEYVQAARDAKKAVDELTQKVSELKGTSKCDSCGYEVAADFAFCPKCGAKIEVKEYFDEEDTEETTVVEEVAEAVEDIVETVEEAVEDVVD